MLLFENDGGNTPSLNSSNSGSKSKEDSVIKNVIINEKHINKLSNSLDFDSYDMIEDEMLLGLAKLQQA